MTLFAALQLLRLNKFQIYDTGTVKNMYYQVLFPDGNVDMIKQESLISLAEAVEFANKKPLKLKNNFYYWLGHAYGLYKEKSGSFITKDEIIPVEETIYGEQIKTSNV